jgi:hypothetical protein
VARTRLSARFERNREDVHGNGRASHAWHVVSATSSPVIKQNGWRDCVCSSSLEEILASVISVSLIAGLAPTGTTHGRTLRSEHANGGVFRIESGRAVPAERPFRARL